VNTGSHNSTIHNARGHDAVGRSTALGGIPREPGHLLDSLPDSPSIDRLPGIEWVFVSIVVICLTALHQVNRREEAARFARMQHLQQPEQNQHTVPNGFGPLTSHGGEHGQHHFTP